MRANWWRRSSRMPFSDIHDNDILFITTNVKNRRWYFVFPKRAERLGQAIQTCCQIKGFELLAYCILPDHVHLLVKKRPLGGMRPGEDGSASLVSGRRLSSRRVEETGEGTLGSSPPRGCERCFPLPQSPAQAHVRERAPRRSSFSSPSPTL